MALEATEPDCERMKSATAMELSRNSSGLGGKESNNDSQSKKETEMTTTTNQLNHNEEAGGGRLFETAGVPDIPVSVMTGTYFDMGKLGAALPARHHWHP